MADKPTPSPNLNINPPPPSSTSGSASNAPFTPRSSTFPDDLNSDDEDVFDPTPVHSPGGPHYDDLPPSYDEAQQQALNDARNGVPPLDPNNLEVHRIHLNDAPNYEASTDYQVPANAEVHAHRATAAELERENGRNASGLGVNVPVQQNSNAEHIPIGRVQDTNPTLTRNASSPMDPASALLNTALEFTKHEPDADARYAPRLTRCVAIPQEGMPRSRKGKGRQDCGRRGRRGGSRGRGRGHRHVPGQWPDTSSENLPFENAEGPAQFLRAYAKALHAHSIRPAEFLDFLDGLNALCAATNTTPADLANSDSGSDSRVDIVRNYINATNEAFFGPRGLKVSVSSLATLLDTVKIPEERGQRAGAVASVLDDKSNAQRRAQALHPWIEALETSVPEPSIAALMLQEMGERFRHPPPAQAPSEAGAPAQARDPEKSHLEREYAARETSDASDPPHSIPGAFPPGQDPSWPPFGGLRGRGSWGRPGRGWGPFGAPGNGPFGPPGFGPFGPRGHGPHGPPGHTPWGPFGAPGNGPWGLGSGFRGRPGPGCSAGRRGPGSQPTNGWQAWGENIGKWGEEFGKRMEIWGEQFGKQAETWGTDFGKRAEAWGEEVGRTASGRAGPSGTQNTQRAQEQSEAPHVAEADALQGQETGVHREETGNSSLEAELQKKAEKKKSKHNDDDDASSISSDSSSDSDSDSDSDDEENYPDTEKVFLDRVREINTAADASRAKGKKSPQDIERDRALAIEKAEKDKTALETKIELKRMKRSVFRDFRTQRRDLKRDHRHVRRDLRRQGLGKKSKEWKNIKKGYREKKKELRKEKEAMRRDFREAKWERKRMRREGWSRDVGNGEIEGMVWVVVENLV